MRTPSLLNYMSDGDRHRLSISFEDLLANIDSINRISKRFTTFEALCEDWEFTNTEHFRLALSQTQNDMAKMCGMLKIFNDHRHDAMTERKNESL